jgi:Ni,Fe-hydrogenase III small subunit
MRKLLFKSLLSAPLTEPAPGEDAAMVAELAQTLDRAARRRLGRSLSIREVDAGSCNGCELEIHALSNVFYDLERFGLRFVASPRHADVLLVTGPVTHNMREALERTYRATPDPKWVVAVGDCAFDGRFCRKLCVRRRRRESGPDRPPHSRLSAESDRSPARTDRAGRECGCQLEPLCRMRARVPQRQVQVCPALDLADDRAPVTWLVHGEGRDQPAEGSGHDAVAIDAHGDALEGFCRQVAHA